MSRHIAIASANPGSLAVGAGFLVLSELMFVSMGASIKSVAVYLPNEMVVFFRNLIAVGLLLPLFMHGKSVGLKTDKFRLHLLRSLAGLGAMYCFFYTLANIELAHAAVLKMTAPLFIPVIAWVWLSESVHPMVRWSILVGFSGVVLIAKPGMGGLDWVMLIALLGGIFAALAKVAVRRLSNTEPGSRIVFYFASIGTLVSLLPALLNWVTPPPEAWVWILAIGGFATLGQLSMTRAFGLAPAAKVGVFSYSSMVFATILGWLFWDEVLDQLDVMGALLVFTAGLMIRHAHRREMSGT